MGIQWEQRAILLFYQHSLSPQNPSPVYQAVLLSSSSMHFHHCHDLSPFLEVVLRRRELNILRSEIF